MFNTLLSVIDLFGIPVTINFSGRQKFNSNFGGICTLIFVGFVIWSVYNGGKDLISRDNPKVIISETYTDDPRALTISANTFPISVQVTAPMELGFINFKDESIYKMNIIYGIRDLITYPNGTTEMNFIETPLATETCTPEHFGELAESFSSLSLEYSYCIAKDQPDFKELAIKGSLVSTRWQYLLIQMVQCNNATSSIPCAPPEVIDQYLQGGWFYASYGNMAVNAKNYSNPATKYKDPYAMMINSNHYRATTIELGHVEVLTDGGWLVSETEQKSYAKVNKIAESLQLSPNSNSVVAECMFVMSKLETEYIRSYKKVPDLFAEVGGIANAALVVIIILSSPYLRLKFSESLINELFDIYTTSAISNAHNKPRSSLRPKSILTPSLKDRNDGDIKGQYEMFSSEENNIFDSPKSNNPRETLFGQGDISYITQTDKGEVSRSVFESNLKKGSLFSSTPLSPISARTFRTKKEKSDPLRSIHHTLKAPSVAPRESFQKTHDDIIDQKSKVPISQRLSSDVDLRRQDKDLSRASLFSEKKKFDKLGEKVIHDEPERPSLIFAEDSIDQIETPAGNNMIDQQNFDQEKVEALRKEEDTVTVKITEDRPVKIEIPSRKKNLNADDPPQAIPNVVEPTTAPSEKINVNVWEYLGSFLHKSKKLQTKIDLLSEGMKNVETRMDVMNIMKKLREVDKLKAILLDPDQHLLFNHLPKPEIRPKKLMRSDSIKKLSFSHGLLKNTAFIETGGTEIQVAEAYGRLEMKAKKNKIDERLISVFKDKLS